MYLFIHFTYLLVIYSARNKALIPQDHHCSRCAMITKHLLMKQRALKVEHQASIWVLFHCSCIH